MLICLKKTSVLYGVREGISASVKNNLGETKIINYTYIYI